MKSRFGLILGILFMEPFCIELLLLLQSDSDMKLLSVCLYRLKALNFLDCVARYKNCYVSSMLRYLHRTLGRFFDDKCIKGLDIDFRILSKILKISLTFIMPDASVIWQTAVALWCIFDLLSLLFDLHIYLLLFLAFKIDILWKLITRSYLVISSFNLANLNIFFLANFLTKHQKGLWYSYITVIHCKMCMRIWRCIIALWINIDTPGCTYLKSREINHLGINSL